MKTINEIATAGISIACALGLTLGVLHGQSEQDQNLAKGQPEAAMPQNQGQSVQPDEAAKTEARELEAKIGKDIEEALVDEGAESEVAKTEADEVAANIVRDRPASYEIRQRLINAFIRSGISSSKAIDKVEELVEKIEQALAEDDDVEEDESGVLY